MGRTRKGVRRRRQIPGGVPTLPVPVGPATPPATPEGDLESLGLNEDFDSLPEVTQTGPGNIMYTNGEKFPDNTPYGNGFTHGGVEPEEKRASKTPRLKDSPLFTDDQKKAIKATIDAYNRKYGTNISYDELYGSGVKTRGQLMSGKKYNGVGGFHMIYAKNGEVKQVMVLNGDYLGTKEKADAYYESGLRATLNHFQPTAGNGTEYITTHEYAHTMLKIWERTSANKNSALVTRIKALRSVAVANDRKLRKALSDGIISVEQFRKRREMSNYAYDNINEFWAETSTRYLLGERGGGTPPPVIREIGKIWEEIIGKK